MSVNAEYERVYNDDFADFRATWKSAREAALAEWNQRVAAEQKRCWPRKRKNYPDLPDDFVQPLRADILAKHRIAELDEQLWQLREARDKRLDELAPLVDFLPVPAGSFVVARSYTAAYRSQGLGVFAYTRGALAPLENRLKQLGFATRIHYEIQWKNPQGRYDCERHGGEYQLLANCPEWMADAAERTLTLQQAVKDMKAAGVNPLVYNPFLSSEVAG